MSSATRADWLRAARERTLVGARLALEVLLLVTSAAVVWLLAMWSVGALSVYADSPEDAPVARSRAPQPQAAQASQREDEYAFDGLPRELDGAPACPDIELTEYAGDSIRLLPVARVAAPFRERLVQLEQAVRETALHLAPPESQARAEDASSRGPAIVIVPRRPNGHLPTVVTARDAPCKRSTLHQVGSGPPEVLRMISDYAHFAKCRRQKPL